MRELVYTGFMSLDGVLDSPGGGPGEEHRSGGWVIKDIEVLPGGELRRHSLSYAEELRPLS